jgi:hypothetical protein
MSDEITLTMYTYEMAGGSDHSINSVRISSSNCEHLLRLLGSDSRLKEGKQCACF